MIGGVQPAEDGDRIGSTGPVTAGEDRGRIAGRGRQARRIRPERRRGLSLLLDWLEDQPGASWQQRWLASGAEAAGEAWAQGPARWLERAGKYSPSRLELMTSSLLAVVGVLLLSARGGREFAKVDWRAIGFALLTALTICTYSVVDGIGARLSGNAPSYTLWTFIGNAIVMVPYALYRDGRGVFPAVRFYWRRGLTGGALQVLSYGIVLWAMTLTPIAIVATLRETSVLFGAAIAVVWLKEPLRPVRIAAALLIVAGLVLIRSA